MSAWGRLKRAATLFLAFVLGHFAWALVGGIAVDAAASAGHAFPEGVAVTTAPLGGLLATAYVAGVFDT